MTTASASFGTIQLVTTWLLLATLLWAGLVGTFLAVDHVICGLLRQRRQRVRRQAKARADERDLRHQLARIDADTDTAVQRLGAAYQRAQALIRQEAAGGGRDELS